MTLLLLFATQGPAGPFDPPLRQPVIRMVPLRLPGHSTGELAAFPGYAVSVTGTEASRIGTGTSTVVTPRVGAARQLAIGGVARTFDSGTFDSGTFDVTPETSVPGIRVRGGG